MRASTPGSLDLGPPQAGISDHDGYRVATEPIVDENGAITGYVQYGRSLEHVDSTVDRVWFFIAGILGGTLLASLAGVAVASRAMRPVASLTATAREIAMTRDPSQRMPVPTADDEVGELADTLDQMLRSLDEARAEREAAMQRQREFVADASHELRTPLTSVLANLELLQASLGDARPVRRRRDRRLRPALLAADEPPGRRPAAARPRRRRPARQPPPLRPRRDRRRGRRRGGAADGRARPDRRQRPRPTDRRQPRRAPPPGPQPARQRRPPHPAGPTSSSACASEDGNAIVDVADDGPGIPAERREQIFERFVRGAGPADTPAGTGTGLGLAIVAAVADSHGGSVEVTESKSGGALFRARIPLAIRDEQSEPKTKPLEAL